MSWSLVGTDAVGFNDGGTGHVYTMSAGAPALGDLDVLCVNSDTVVSTPSGFIPAATVVSGQGSYLFYRLSGGSDGATVTVTTSGNFDTSLIWLRWTGAQTLDTTATANVDGSAGTSTPAVTTGELANAGELVVAFAALHTPGSATPVSVTWSTGYTAATQGAQGAVAGLVGYNTNAGTAAESPAVSWTNDYFDRYLLVAVWASAGGMEPDDDTSVPGQMTAATATPSLTPATAGARLALTTSGGDA